MINPYDESYFNSGNYVGGYLGRSNRYTKLAQEIIELFLSIKYINTDDKILDYGCAVGFLLDGLYEFGYKNTHGYDISEWAISKLNKDRHKVVSIENSSEKVFDIGFFLDVLEHMTDNQIKDVFTKIVFDKIVVRIPCSIDGKTFLLPQSRLDETHINCKVKEGWVSLMSSIGYDLVFHLNLKQIYDTDGVFCAVFRRKR